jgi:hypothetical protein
MATQVPCIALFRGTKVKEGEAGVSVIGLKNLVAAPGLREYESDPRCSGKFRVALSVNGINGAVATVHKQPGNATLISTCRKSAILP